jgi:hypothetical protein
MAGSDLEEVMSREGAEIAVEEVQVRLCSNCTSQ